MPQSPSTKRKHTSDETELPPKRKIRSCETCRRLKTRCEVEYGSIACHRCGILKQDCSLEGADALPDSADQCPPPKEHLAQHTPPQSSEIDQRLLALENSLASVRASLDEILSLQGQTSRQNEDTTRSSREKGCEKGCVESAPSMNLQFICATVADRNSRTAPASLIRDMKHYILGEERGSQKSEPSEDIVAKGIVTEEMAQSFLTGFSKLSRRWLFMHSDPSSLRQAPSLLRACCVLAGLQIDSSLHGSQLHHELYQHVSSLLSRRLLCSPLSLEAIQSMLIFSMWNLVPNNDTEYLDPWLLSGVAGMQGMLAINFEHLLKPRTDGLVDPRSRETFRSWNLICLCHLQFSVGTGRPPVLSRQYLKQCKNILSLPSYNSQDQLVAEGVELYDSVCHLVNSDTVQTDSLVWDEIDDWKKRCGQFFELDSSKPLRFAYSCSYLILTRRTLKYLSEQPTKNLDESLEDVDLDPSLYIQLAVEHAHRILHLFLAMSDLTAFVRPAYENLLCSFAMVTLSEFGIYLNDIDQTLALMERTSQHVQLGGKAEPVSKWALSVMRKYVADNSKDVDFELGQPSTFTPKQGLGVSTVNHTGLSVEFETGDWASGDTRFLDFPSLEEMFLGN